MRLALWAAAAALGLTGCSIVATPGVIRTASLVPPQRGEDADVEAQMAMRFPGFVDERADRSSVGARETVAGSAPFVPDGDIAEVFRAVAMRAFARKGIRSGPSPFVLKGSVRGAGVNTFAGSPNYDGRVNVHLAVIDSRTQARLWQRDYEGKGVGADPENVLAQAFNDLAGAIERDDSVLQTQQAYIAAGGRAPSSQSSAAAAPAAPQYNSDVDQPTRRASARPNDYALVIGVEKYQGLPDASYAERDADAVRAHLHGTLGVPEENIIALRGDRATRTGFVKYIEEWLPRNVNENSRVYFYYSGHGAPDPVSGSAYLVPWDGDPSFLDSTAYPVARLYDKLGALKAKQIIVALDSCFSGAGGRSVLVKGARPLVNVQQAPQPGAKISALLASSGDQISGTDDPQGHGLFTYYLLKGLDGAAVQADHVSMGSLYDYVRQNVQRFARRQNREQTVQLRAADPDLAFW